MNRVTRTGFINPLAWRVAADRAPAGPQPTTPIVRCGEDQRGGSRQDPPPEGIDETTCSHKPLATDTVERILIVLPNWFGETLFATPQLATLRRARPQARISVMGVERCRDVLAHHPHIEEFVLYDEEGRHRRLRDKLAVVSALRAKRFDAVIILRRSLSRTLLLAAAGIPRRIGFANAKSGWLLTDRVPMPASGHKAHRYLALLVPLGIDDPAPGRCEYYLSDEERAWAGAWLREHAIDPARPLVILHPGANWAHKRWPAERFGQLADRLAQRGASVVVSGGPDDVRLITAVLGAMSKPPIVLAGQTTLRQLAACLERASLVITNDTGPAHLAAALGRPLIALFGPTLPNYTGPLGDPDKTVVVHHRDCCPQLPCLNPEHPSHLGMSTISVDEVADACDRILGEARGVSNN